MAEKRKQLKGRVSETKKTEKKPKRTKELKEIVTIQHVLPPKKKTPKQAPTKAEIQKQKAAETHHKLAVQNIVSMLNSRRLLLKRRRKAVFSQFANLSYEYTAFSKVDLGQTNQDLKPLLEDEDIITAKTRFTNEYMLIKHIENIVRFLEANDTIDNLPAFLRYING
jgi:hypothetical protein